MEGVTDEEKKCGSVLGHVALKQKVIMTLIIQSKVVEVGQIVHFGLRAL